MVDHISMTGFDWECSIFLSFVRPSFEVMLCLEISAITARQHLPQATGLHQPNKASVN